MIRYLLLSLIAITIIIEKGGLNAQEVISPAGGYYESTNASISWTLGEPVIETFSTANNVLTQGFQQSKLEITSVDDIGLTGVDINVYPNPVRSNITIDFNIEGQKELNYSLYDAKGNILINKDVLNDQEVIDMEEYKAAIYFLKITSGKKEAKTYRIVKH